MAQHLPAVYEGSNRVDTNRQVRADSDDTSSCIPMSLSSAAVFDLAFDLVKSNLAPILLIVTLAFLPLHFIEQYIVSSWLNPKYIGLDLQDQGDANFALFGQMLTLSLEYIATGYPRFGIPGVFLLLTALFTSAPVSAAVTDIIAGRHVSVIDNYRAAWASRMQLVWCSLLTILCCFAVWAFTTAVIGILGLVPLLLLMGLASGLSSTMAANWVFVIYLLSCVLIPLAVMCLFYGRTFAFAMPVCVNERTSAMAGIARSQQLAGAVPYSTTFLIFTMLPVAVLAVQLMLVFGCNSALELLHFAPIWEYLGSTAISALIVCLLHAYWMVYVTRLYYDFRVKRECLDIRMLIARDSTIDSVSVQAMEPGN